jgi:alkylation response protein AidB-like acyl-CoA dehydrogenase
MRIDELLSSIDKLIETDASPIIDEYEDSGVFPKTLVQRLCAMGIPNLVHGSAPVEAPTSLFCQIIERVAMHWVALAESVHLQTLAACGLAYAGSGHLKERYLERMQTGALIGANCLSEPNAGSDLSQIQTTATLCDGGFILDGHKLWVGHADVADVFNVYARTASSALGGLTCFLVDANSPGIEILPREKKMGVRALPTCAVTFKNVFVPERQIVGRINRGMIVANTFFIQGRIGIAACAVGLAQAAMQRAVRYAKERSQFGAKIISFQGISFILADMSVQIEAARQLLLFACRERDQGGRRAEMLAAQAKLFATDMAMKVTTDAVQVLGAYGYTMKEPTERWMREAKLFQIIEGTNQIQRISIASKL